MPKYYLTFGTQYAEHEHPYFPEAHPDGWIEIDDVSELNARQEAFNCFEDKWAFLYNEKNFNPVQYSAGRIATLEEVKKDDLDRGLLFYKINPTSHENPITISSENEKINTLSPEGMMVMNNVSRLFNNLATFTRTDKFNKHVDSCMNNIMAGLSNDKDKSGEQQISFNEMEYSLKIKDKISELIEAIKTSQ